MLATAVFAAEHAAASNSFFISAQNDLTFNCDHTTSFEVVINAFSKEDDAQKIEKFNSQLFELMAGMMRAHQRDHSSSSEKNRTSSKEDREGQIAKQSIVPTLFKNPTVVLKTLIHTNDKTEIDAFFQHNSDEAVMEDSALAEREDETQLPESPIVNDTAGPSFYDFRQTGGGKSDLEAAYAKTYNREHRPEIRDQKQNIKDQGPASRDQRASIRKQRSNIRYHGYAIESSTRHQGECGQSSKKEQGLWTRADRMQAIASTSAAGSRTYLGMSQADVNHFHQFVSQSLGIVPYEIKPSDQVDHKKVSADSAIVMPTRVRGMTVLMYFVQTDNALVFAGWEKQEQIDDALINKNTFQIPSFDPARDFERSALGLGTPGGESAPEYKYPTVDEDVIAERFASLIIAQLKMGPDALAGGGSLRSLNALMFNGYHSYETVSSGQWEDILHKALSLATRNTPIFNGNGLRSIIDIQNDVCRVLRIDPSTFYAWENHFGVDIVAEQIFTESERSIGGPQVPAILEQAISSLDRRIEIMAGASLGSPQKDLAINRKDEVTLHWHTAMLSALPNVEDKIALAKEFIAGHAQKGKKNLAGRALALIVSNTDLNGHASSDDSILMRWSEAQLGSLVGDLMKSEVWDIVSHRSFRQHLSPEQNKIVNSLIYSANYDQAMHEVGKIDVTKASVDEVFDAIRRTGMEEIIFNDIISRMGRYNFN